MRWTMLSRYDKRKQTLITAASLLLDKNLVWDDDLEQIREPLGRALLMESLYEPKKTPLLEIATNLTREEFDVSS